MSHAVRLARSCLAAASSSSPRPHRLAPALAHRAYHSRVELPYDIDAGLLPFLSQKAIRTVAVEYQDGLLARLNDHIRGQEGLANRSIVDVLIHTAQQKSGVLAFNYASLALNNSFFLDGLTNDPSRPSGPTPPTRSPTPSPTSSYFSSVSSNTTTLHESLLRSFDSISVLKSLFASHALGMASTGYVWLVSDWHNNLSVIATYGPGTILCQYQARMAENLYAVGADTENEVAADEADRTKLADLDAPREVGRGAGAQAEGDRRANPRLAFDAYDSEYTYGSGGAGSGRGGGYGSGPYGGYGGYGGGPPPSSTGPSTGPTASPPTIPHSRPSNLPGSPPSSNPSSSPFTPPPFTRSLSNTARLSSDALRASSQTRSPSTTAAELYPLLCLSVHEHAWMLDYGVWGKEEYARNFWEVVDWRKVEQRWKWVQGVTIRSSEGGRGLGRSQVHLPI